MDDRDLSDLLTDAVADVEPADRLTEIRERTAARPRRVGWYAAGGTLLAVAVTVTAVALVASSGPKAEDPPTGSTTTSPDPSETPGLAPVPVYFVGNTPAGDRLYREFHLLGGRGAPVAAQAVTTGPDDPDYRTLWPEGSVAQVDVRGGVINVTVADPSLHDRPASMTKAEAELAIQQMIFTVQAAEGSRQPVQFRLGANPVDRVFGVPTSEPLANAAPLDVVSWANISDPAEGRVVDTNTFTARGTVESFDGSVQWEVLDVDGQVVLDGYGLVVEPDLVPQGWQTQVDVSSLRPGTYMFTVHGNDYPTTGRSTDTRTIVVQ